jgi:hypothetical protein
LDNRCVLAGQSGFFLSRVKECREFGRTLLGQGNHYPNQGDQGDVCGEGSRERPQGDAQTIRVLVDVGSPRPNVEDLRRPLVARDF